MKYIKGDIFINNIISDFAEILAYLAAGVTYEYLGLKSTLIISYVIAISAILFLVSFNPNNQMMLGMCILGAKFGVC